MSKVNVMAECDCIDRVRDLLLKQASDVASKYPSVSSRMFEIANSLDDLSFAQNCITREELRRRRTDIVARRRETLE